jgi:hypothetical protein
MPFVIKYVKRNRTTPTQQALTPSRYYSLVFSPVGPVGGGSNRSQKTVSTSAVRCVLAALIKRCRYNEELRCHPSIRTIAKDSGLNASTVQLAIRQAAQRGWLDIRKHKPPRPRKKGRRPPNEYWLLIPDHLGAQELSTVWVGYRSHSWQTAFPSIARTPREGRQSCGSAARSFVRLVHPSSE